MPDKIRRGNRYDQEIIFLFLHKNKCCDGSNEGSQCNGSNDVSQHMFSLRKENNSRNYPQNPGLPEAL